MARERDISKSIPLFARKPAHLEGVTPARPFKHHYSNQYEGGKPITCAMLYRQKREPPDRVAPAFFIATYRKRQPSK